MRRAERPRQAILNQERALRQQLDMSTVASGAGEVLIFVDDRDDSQVV